MGRTVAKFLQGMRPRMTIGATEKTAWRGSILEAIRRKKAPPKIEYTPCYVPYVPTEELRPLVTLGIEEAGSLARFSDLSGVGYKTLEDILSGARRVARFYIADCIITTGLGQPHLWYSTPVLAEIYERAGMQCLPTKTS